MTLFSREETAQAQCDMALQPVLADFGHQIPHAPTNALTCSGSTA